MQWAGGRAAPPTNSRCTAGGIAPRRLRPGSHHLLSGVTAAAYWPACPEPRSQTLGDPSCMYLVTNRLRGLLGPPRHRDPARNRTMTHTTARHPILRLPGQSARPCLLHADVVLYDCEGFMAHASRPRPNGSTRYPQELGYTASRRTPRPSAMSARASLTLRTNRGSCSRR